MTPIVLIPARMASTRLPGKPLEQIEGRPMLLHVISRANEAFAGLNVTVAVSAADQSIVDAVRGAGFACELTDPALPSGSDRIAAHLAMIDPDQKYDAVINLQGDLPTLEPEAIRAVAQALESSGADIATLVAPCAEEDRDNPNVVKAVVSLAPGATLGRALYFTRATAPHGDGPLWHHIGIYAYTRAALARFVALPPSPLELREKLEQLRALEAGMTIAVAVVGGVPLGVDTPEDLEKARAILAARKG